MKTISTALFGAALSLLFSLPAAAADAQAKASYQAAKERAEADYKVARARCDSLAGNAKDVCVAEAKAVEKKAKAQAEASYKNTPEARADARIDSAEADYSVAKAKCDSLAGDSKDACVKEAKAAQRKSVDQAKAERKSASGA